MTAGKRPFGGNPQAALLGMSGLMVVPCLMPFLSLVLPVQLNRWLNMIFGVVYSLIMIATFALERGWYFYLMYGLIGVIFTLLILWYSVAWPVGALPTVDTSASPKTLI